MSGIVKLLDQNGEIVRVNVFYSKNDKNKIIAQWERLYAKAFLRCTIVEESDARKVFEKSPYRRPPRSRIKNDID